MTDTYDYTYDTVGNLLTVTDPDSALTMTYDQANRLLTTSTAGSSNQPSVTLTYTYDKNGNRLTLADGTSTNTYVYDVLNRLTSLTSPAGANTFGYDALSRRTSLTLPNGTSTTYTYDVASQVTNILHKITATSAQINKADYLYNTVGNRTSLTDRRGAQSFGYDNLDRLTSASHPLLGTPQAFAYDGVGNRTTAGNVHNAGNQLTADANYGYQYDDNGNLTRKTLLATGNFTVYSYDAENRLTKVEDFAAGNPTPAFTSTYRYDGLGRRIEKVANGQTKRYIYDGEDILLEYDGANVLQARYTHGPGIDEPIAVTKGSSTYFYHQDGLGTITDLTDSSGATAKSYAYDAYGNILESPGTVEQPYTYTGREFDSESGLYYYRNRYFVSQAGRFLTRDPLGISRSPNVYNYVFNNPLNLTDPTGLAGGRGATPSHGSSLGSGWGGVQNWVDGFNWRRQQWQGGRDHWQAIRDRCAELRKNIDDLRGSCPKDPQSQDLLKQLEEILNWCDQNFPPGAPMPSPVPAPSGAGGGRSNEPSIAPAQAVLGAAAAVAVACALVPEVCIPAGATAAAIAAGIITIPH